MPRCTRCAGAAAAAPTPPAACARDTAGAHTKGSVVAPQPCTPPSATMLGGKKGKGLSLPTLNSCCCAEEAWRQRKSCGSPGAAPALAPCLNSHSALTLPWHARRHAGRSAVGQRGTSVASCHSGAPPPKMGSTCTAPAPPAAPHSCRRRHAAHVVSARATCRQHTHTAADVSSSCGRRWLKMQASASSGRRDAPDSASAIVEMPAASLGNNK